MANVGTLSVNVVAVTGQFDARMGSVRQQLQLTSIATKGISGGLSGMLGTLGALGPAAAGAAAIALGMMEVKHQVSATVSTFADFEATMSRVKAIAEPTTDEFQRLWATAKIAGEATVFTASDAAKAMVELSQAGMNASQINASLGGTLNLAAAGELEMAEAARIATNAMSNFQLTVTSANGVADLLAKAAADSKTNVQELGQALEFIGPVAKSAGKDIFETVAVLEAMAQQGLRGEKAGTGLRRMLMDMSELTPKARAELERLKIDLTDGDGRFKHSGEIIDEFNSKLSEMGPADRLESLGKIFDQNAITAMTALMSEGGDSIRNFEEASRLAGEEAKRMADTSMDNLKGKTEKLSGSIERLRITLGEGGLGRELKGIVDLTADATSSFSKMLEALQSGGNAAEGEGFIEHRFKSSQKFLAGLVEKTARAFGNTEFADAMKDEIDATFNGIKKSAESTTTAIEELNKAKNKVGSDGAGLTLGGNIEDLAKRAKQITDAMRTPVELFETKIEELNTLVNAGQLTWETYGRAVTDALEEVNQLASAKQRLDRPVQVGAVARGTTAGFSAERQAIAALNQLKSAEQTASRQREAIQKVLERILNKPPDVVAGGGGGAPVTVNNVSL